MIASTTAQAQDRNNGRWRRDDDRNRSDRQNRDWRRNRNDDRYRGRRDDRYGRNDRYDRNGRYGNYGGYNNGAQIELNQGYQAGLSTGSSDARRGQSYNPQRSHYYKDARSQQFRNGFVRGYAEGFRQYGGYNNNGDYRRLIRSNQLNGMPRLIVVAFSFRCVSVNPVYCGSLLKQYYSSGSGNYSGDSSLPNRCIRHEHLSELDFLVRQNGGRKVHARESVRCFV
jgi:hypothetical protein